ncbi:hypothetical protein JCM5353_001289 [Sporobolomyces roseus]
MTRRRSGSLELDYGDDPLQDQMSSDQPPRSPPQQQAEIKPIATLEASKVDTRPQIVQPIKREPSSTPASTSTLPTLPGGLPANPLTGRVPSTSNNMGMNATGAGNGQYTACFISDMHWWTSDQHLVDLCQLAGVTSVGLKDVSFSEHKVNGKSKGVAYIETGSVDSASLVKRYVDANEYQSKRMGCTLVIGSNLGSPFKTLPREPHRQNGQQTSNNPANQSNRPGLRIPPPCTYPYINSREQQGQNQNQQQQQGKRGFNQVGGNGNGMGMGMGMAQNNNNGGGGMAAQGMGGGGNQNYSRPQQSSYPIPQSQQLAPQIPQQQASVPVPAMNNMMGGAGGGGFDASQMFGMNPFAGMGGMGMGGMGGFNPMAGMGGMGGMNGMGAMGGFDMTGGMGGFGTMDFSQMGNYGMGQQQQQQQGGGQAKRSRTDGQ